MADRDKVIKGLEHCAEDGCKGCPYVEDCDMEDGFTALARDVLVLLKAQESKSPITSEVQYCDHLQHCPSCGKALPNRGAYGKSHYCYKCGQAVKWE